jgi:hypothetical protein
MKFRIDPLLRNTTPRLGALLCNSGRKLGWEERWQARVGSKLAPAFIAPVKAMKEATGPFMAF